MTEEVDLTRWRLPKEVPAHFRNLALRDGGDASEVTLAFPLFASFAKSATD